MATVSRKVVTAYDPTGNGAFMGDVEFGEGRIELVSL